MDTERNDGRGESRMERRLQLYLQEVEGCFDQVPSLLRDHASLLPSLPDPHHLLRRRERRIVFFGALNAGKSSLINALLGAPALPVRSNRTTGIATVLRYGSPPRASLIRDGQEEAIDIRAAADSVLLDGRGAIRDRSIEEVRIDLPLAILEGDRTIVDTPGVLERETLTERTLHQLEGADLGVMVLSADKVLSARERDLAKEVAGLLNGSVIFVVNRLDLIDEDDREDVLDWVRASLQGSGNPFVGKPCLFATVAKRGADDCSDLARWLTHLFGSVRSNAVVTLSRLGILAHDLSRLDLAIQAKQIELRDALRRAREGHEQALALERAEMVERVTRAQLELQQCGNALESAGEEFVARTLEAARGQLNSAAERPKTLRLSYEAALEHYETVVMDAIHLALAGAPVNAPPFKLQPWFVHTDIIAASHPTSELGALFGELATRVVDGGGMGREAGTTIGGWIGKNVFHVDVEAETLQRIERAARNALPALRAEANRYVTQVDALLRRAVTFYGTWTRSSPAVKNAEEQARSYDELLAWCADCLGSIQRISEAIEGLALEGG